MLTTSDNKKVLKIFENFETNFKLPKYTRKTLPKVDKVLLSDEIERAMDPQLDPDAVIVPANSFISFQNSNSSTFIQGPTVTSGVFFGSANEGSKGEEKTSFKNFFQKLLDKLRNKKKYDLIALKDFFTRIPLNDLESSIDLIKYYENSIAHAEKIGQVSLKERLLKNLNVVRAEIALIDSKLTKFVSEEQLVDLYQQSNVSQNLKLTWIKNFVKIIPTNILEIKEKVDQLEIFDNYVILHYDPNNDATSMTEAEVKLKKDPILFGVFSDSRKLYYIADWIDEYCDLTLEKMFNILKENVLEINNESVKSFINDNRNTIPRQKKETEAVVTA